MERWSWYLQKYRTGEGRQLTDFVGSREETDQEFGIRHNVFATSMESKRGGK